MNFSRLNSDDDLEKVLGLATCLISAAEVDKAYDRMAQAITAQLSHTRPCLLVVLTGGMIPAVKLMSRLKFPLTVDTIHATRYQSGTVGGELEIRMQPHHSLRDRTVIIIDDILDEGVTLAEVVQYCIQSGAADVYTSVLLEKKHNRRTNGFEADFVGLSVGDSFVCGEGLDLNEYFRNLNGIYTLKVQDE